MLRPTLIYTQTEEAGGHAGGAGRSVAEHVGARRRGRQDPLGGPARCAGRRRRRTGRTATRFRVEGLHVRRRGSSRSAPNGGKIELPETARRTADRHRGGLDDVLRREAGKRLLGVVLLSDDAQRALRPARPAAANRRRAAETPRAIRCTPSPSASRAAGRGPRRGRQGPGRRPRPCSSRTNWRSPARSASTATSTARFPSACCFETAPGKMEVVAQQTIKADGRRPTPAGRS